MENNKNFCSNCGKPIEGNPTYCPNCGNKLSGSLDLDLDKGKETLKNVSKSTTQAFEKLSDKVSKKTGHKISSKTIMGALASIIIVGGIIFFLLPEHLSGTYTNSTNLIITDVKTRLYFKGDTFTQDDDKKGTYKIDGNKISFKENVGNRTEKFAGKISKDRKTIDVMGMKFTKDEK